MAALRSAQALAASSGNKAPPASKDLGRTPGGRLSIGLGAGLAGALVAWGWQAPSSRGLTGTLVAWADGRLGRAGLTGTLVARG